MPAAAGVRYQGSCSSRLLPPWSHFQGVDVQIRALCTHFVLCETRDPHVSSLSPLGVSPARHGLQGGDPWTPQGTAGFSGGSL